MAGNENAERTNIWLIIEQYSRIITGIVGLGLALVPNVTYEVEAYEQPKEPTVEELITQHFGDKAERMTEIFKCESGLKQFKDGEVIMSPTRDFGISQINEKTWDKTFQQMGLDYKNSLTDNILAAKHIYTVSGEAAWVCSKLV
jgi:hypothetical protein